MHMGGEWGLRGWEVVLYVRGFEGEFGGLEFLVEGRGLDLEVVLE